MASIISAGTTSGTALNMAGDTSGVLQLATNGSTTALTIDTSQRAAFVAGTAALPAITTTGDTNTGIWFPAADTIAFAEGGTESMRIDSSGNVIVNDTAQSGSAKLTVKQTADTTIGGIAFVATDGNGAVISRLTDGGLTFRNGGAERMRILSTGETVQNAAYSGGGATNTAFALNTTYRGARIRARGAENGNNNTSYTEYLGIWSSSTGWNIVQTARAANGNGYGSIILGISGNYVTVSFDVSTIGGWWANVEYFI
jgi:hypothetical protein